MRVLIYIILCWIISRVNSNNDKIVSARVVYIASSYSIFSLMGGSPYFRKKLIDQMQDICWSGIPNDLKTNGTFISQNEYGEIYENTLILDGNLTLNNFPMLTSSQLFQKQADHTLSGLGMCFKFKNESQSIVHQLKAMNLISKLSYSFSVKDSYEGHIFFGGIPNNITDNKTKSECKINPDKIEWSCVLSKISLGEYTYNKPHDAYFQVAERYIRAPLDFMNYFEYTVLKEPIKTKKCFHSKVDLQIFCLREVINQLKIISFTIGDYKYSFNSSLLFEPYRDAGCKIRLNHYNLNNDSWIIGTAFLDHFSSSFDYDNESVNLYLIDNNSDSIIVSKTESNYLFIICIIILILGLFLLLYLTCFYLK